MAIFTLEVDVDDSHHSQAYRAIIGKALDEARQAVMSTAKMRDQLKIPVANVPDPQVIGRWQIGNCRRSRTRKPKDLDMPTTTATDDRKPIPNLPPLDWKREIPKYRISRDTKPAPKERFRFEPPFSSGSESDVWQYGERVHKAGEVIETTFWPNPGTMTPLNFSAREVISFFTSRQKSRLPRSPWANDQVRLDDGLGGPAPMPGPVRPEPFDMRPASGPNFKRLPIAG